MEMNTEEKMRETLLAWCKAYQKAIDCLSLGKNYKRFIMDYFLEVYQKTVNDRFFEDKQGPAPGIPIFDRHLQYGNYCSCEFGGNDQKTVDVMKKMICREINEGIVPALWRPLIEWAHREKDGVFYIGWLFPGDRLPYANANDALDKWIKGQ